MKKQQLLPLIALFSGSAFAATLSLDFQPTNGTTAAGFQAFEHTDGSAFSGAGADYAEFGGTVNISLTAGGPVGVANQRAVSRTGLAGDLRNDWIGVDARPGSTASPASLTITVSGLPSGNYSWTSVLHDGGDSTTGNGQGNIFGNITTDFNGTAGVALISAQNPANDASDADIQPTSSFSTNFSSTGVADTFALTLTSSGAGADGTAGDAIFVFADSLVITDEVIPEPSSALLSLVGALALLRRRR